MTEHAHDWQPIPLKFNRYACSCGTTGFRNPREGYTITPHKQQRKERPQTVGTTVGLLGHKRHGKQGPGGW